MANIIFIIDPKLKQDFFEKAERCGGASYVLREMIKNYLSLGGFETPREIKTKQANLLNELRRNRDE